MKFFHLSDLHLGKRVNEFSMLEEQQYILERIVDIVDEEQPQGVIIAGDVYDKSVPPAEAVQLFDSFLVSLAERGVEVFVISGNHDSPERVAFGARLMNSSGVHMSPVYSGSISPVTVSDEQGELCVYLLPFVKPAHVRAHHPNAEIDSYTDAILTAVSAMEVDTSKRNLLVTHQFVTGAARCDSEDISVGGSDNVDSTVFAPFDYVALGHIHRAQSIGSNTVRYCGTPLKYSFSEAAHCKSLTVVEMGAKGDVQTREIPLLPRRDLREIKGSYLELTARSYYEHSNCDDYLHVTLTDEEDIPEAIAKLRAIYPSIMKLDYDNARTRAGVQAVEAAEVESLSPLELLARFYELQNNSPMSPEQLAFAGTIIEQIWEGGK